MTPSEPIILKLKRSAMKVNNFIEELLESRKPEVLYDASKHIIRAGGKRLRPYLVLKSCEMVGGDPDIAVPFAGALEVLHSFTLIHDDIMDNSDLRRGVETVHKRWGLPYGIASGDLLFAKVYEAMTKHAHTGTVPCNSVKACIERVTDASIAICEGQVLDVSFSRLMEMSEEDYFSMVGGKTAALFKACAEVGAIVGGGSKKEVEQLGVYAWKAGIAFQLVDDYLDVTAEERTLGKLVGGDIREGKKTLIIIHALSHASPEEREKIESVLGVENTSQSDIKAICELLSNIGSLSYTIKYARRFAEEAKGMLGIFPDSEVKRDLLELVDYYLERTY